MDHVILPAIVASKRRPTPLALTVSDDVDMLSMACCPYVLPVAFSPIARTHARTHVHTHAHTNMRISIANTNLLLIRESLLDDKSFESTLTQDGCKRM